VKNFVGGIRPSAPPGYGRDAVSGRIACRIIYSFNCYFISLEKTQH